MSAPLQQITPIELAPLVAKALEAVKDLPTEQQQAVLEAAAATARATAELRNRLFMTGSILAGITKR